MYLRVQCGFLEGKRHQSINQSINQSLLIIYLFKHGKIQQILQAYQYKISNVQLTSMHRTRKIRLGK